MTVLLSREHYHFRIRMMPFPAPADRSALPGPSSGRRAPATSSHRTQFCIVSIRRPQRHRSRARRGRYHLSGEGVGVPHTRSHAARSVPGRLGRRYSLLRVSSSPEGRPPSIGVGNTSSTCIRFPVGADVAAPVDQVRRDLVYPDGCDPLRCLELRHELRDEVSIVAGEEARGQCFSDGCGGVGFIDRMKLSVGLGWCCERSHAREVGMEV